MMPQTILDMYKTASNTIERTRFICVERLKQEGIFVTLPCTKLCSYSLFKKHSKTGHLVHLPKRMRTTDEIEDEMTTIIDKALLNHDELTEGNLDPSLTPCYPVYYKTYS